MSGSSGFAFRAELDGVGAPKKGLFDIRYPTRRFPCQRFGLALRFHRMTRGRDGSLLLSRRGLPPLDVTPV